MLKIDGALIAVALDGRTQWSVGDYCQALTVDYLAQITYGLGGGKGKRPSPLPRPKRVPSRQHEARTVEEIKKLLAAPRQKVSPVDLERINANG